MPTDTELKTRAITVWTRANPGREPPSFHSATVEEYDGRVYVVLRRNRQVLGICRYKEATANTRDQLSLLRRYYPGPYGRQRVAA